MVKLISGLSYTLVICFDRELHGQALRRRDRQGDGLGCRLTIVAVHPVWDRSGNEIRPGPASPPAETIGSPSLCSTPARSNGPPVTLVNSPPIVASALSHQPGGMLAKRLLDQRSERIAGCYHGERASWALPFMEG
jgi:hypothetical protein